MNKVLKELKSFDKLILKTVKSGVKYCFLFCILAIFLLLIYKFYASPIFYYIGISLFRSGLFFIVAFIMCGVVFNHVKKDLKC